MQAGDLGKERHPRKDPGWTWRGLVYSLGSGLVCLRPGLRLAPWLRGFVDHTDLLSAWLRVGFGSSSVVKADRTFPGAGWIGTTLGGALGILEPGRFLGISDRKEDWF